MCYMLYLLLVIDKPEVILTTSNPYKVWEGTTAKLACSVIDANPFTNITWKWFNAEHNVPYNGPNLMIPSIQRTSSGPYNCTASNIAGTSVAAMIYVDVQCTYIFLATRVMQATYCNWFSFVVVFTTKLISLLTRKMVI